MAAYLPELARRQVGERVRPDLPGQSFRSKQAGLSRQATRVSGVVGKEATGRFPSQACVLLGRKQVVCILYGPFTEASAVRYAILVALRWCCCRLVVGFKRHDWSNRRRGAPGGWAEQWWEWS